MPERAQLLLILFAAVDELNARLPVESRLARSESAPIAGDESRLESLDYVNLVLDYEGRLAEAFGRPAPLAERLVDDEGEGPPSTLGALADLASKVVEGTRR